MLSRSSYPLVPAADTYKGIETLEQKVLLCCHGGKGTGRELSCLQEGEFEIVPVVEEQQG